MQIDFSARELRELRRALDIHLYRLSTELVNAGDRAYREELKASMEVLEDLRRRLEALHPALPEAYPSG